MWLLFDLENGRNMLLQNVDWFSVDYTALNVGEVELLITTAVRTSDSTDESIFRTEELLLTGDG
jgi:hypothetical protein